MFLYALYTCSSFFGRLTLDFRESKCFLRGPTNTHGNEGITTKISANLVDNWITIVSFNSASLNFTIF